MPAGTSETDWIIANLAHSGWYRVNYDDTNWNRLIAQLNTDRDRIHPVHRAQILDDSFNLGRSEILPQTKFFDISLYLADEDDALSFVPAFNGLNFMTTFIEDDLSTFGLYKTYYMDLLTKTYNRLGWRLDIDDANDMLVVLTFYFKISSNLIYIFVFLKYFATFNIVCYVRLWQHRLSNNSCCLRALLRVLRSGSTS